MRFTRRYRLSVIAYTQNVLQALQCSDAVDVCSATAGTRSDRGGLDEELKFAEVSARRSSLCGSSMKGGQIGDTVTG